MNKDCFVGAVIERGKITSVSSGEYTVESIDRPGIVSLPAKPINPETYSVNDIVYFFICQDGTGRVMSKVDRVSPMIPQADIVNDVTTNDSTKVASAAVAKLLNDTMIPKTSIVNNVVTDDSTKVASAAVAKLLNDALRTLTGNLKLRELANSSYKATTTRYEYVNLSFTIPAGCTYLVYALAYYATGAPIGIAISNSNTTLSAATLIRIYESPSSLPCGSTPVYMLVGGTYYLWVKRASVPAGNNSHYVYGAILYKA